MNSDKSGKPTGLQLSGYNITLLRCKTSVRIRVALPYKNTFNPFERVSRMLRCSRRKRFNSSNVFLYGNIAQWLMQLLHTQPIVGSSPTITTKFGRLVKWYNRRLISVNRKFNSCTGYQSTLVVVCTITSRKGGCNCPRVFSWGFAQSGLRHWSLKSVSLVRIQ